MLSQRQQRDARAYHDGYRYRLDIEGMSPLYVGTIADVCHVMRTCYPEVSGWHATRLPEPRKPEEPTR
jgi:hypothetical protein